MEQNLSLEVIGALISGRMHARAVAKKIGCNHMTAARVLKRLTEANALDFKMEGRNKVYFVKKTAEARNFAIMAEFYKLNKLLQKYPELRLIIESIQKNAGVNLAILFGSYAKGMAKKESDIDIFVETKDAKLKQELSFLSTKLSVKIGDYDRSSLLIKEMEKSHVVIKGVEYFYERSGFFS